MGLGLGLGLSLGLGLGLRFHWHLRRRLRCRLRCHRRHQHGHGCWHRRHRHWRLRHWRLHDSGLHDRSDVLHPLRGNSGYHCSGEHCRHTLWHRATDRQQPWHPIGDPGRVESGDSGARRGTCGSCIELGCLLRRRVALSTACHELVVLVNSRSGAPRLESLRYRCPLPARSQLLNKRAQLFLLLCRPPAHLPTRSPLTLRLRHHGHLTAIHRGDDIDSTNTIARHCNHSRRHLLVRLAISFALAVHNLPVLIDSSSRSSGSKPLGNLGPVALANLHHELFQPRLLIRGPTRHTGALPPPPLLHGVIHFCRHHGSLVGDHCQGVQRRRRCHRGGSCAGDGLHYRLDSRGGLGLNLC
mmetsp:Transcript_41471/g.93706  ORF Transcript_41471/g.93706 Transcript_41471/m.93706 type:complete len:356 (+) Transcript_41471:1304-2371(+)